MAIMIMGKSSKGASLSQVQWQDVFQAWYQHHFYSARVSFKKLCASPLQSVMTCLLIAVALALPAALLIVTNQVKSLSDVWDGEPRLTIYVRNGLSEPAIKNLGAQLKKVSGMGGVEYISPEQGLQELKKYGSFGGVGNSLKENPLPPVFLLRLMETDDELALQILTAQLEKLPEVESIQLDMQWVQRIHQVASLIARAATLLGVFLCLGVLLTIGSTIGLSIESRRDEITVIKLVGGTDAFVQRPLLYSGFWYGLVGGIMAWFLLWVASVVLSSPLAALQQSYGSDISLQDFGVSYFLNLSMVGAMLGLLGAWLAVVRHLKNIQPN